MKHLSLLSDAVFRVTTQDTTPHAVERQTLTLPAVLAALSAGSDLGFVALRPHQRPAWHAFIVQLAFLALEAADTTEAPQDAAAWAALLRGLTPQHAGDEPWHLVVDDWTQPAFLQSPCAAGAQGDYRNAAGSAQELDLLVTSKNHDEKIGKLRPVLPDEADVWVYALISLQGFTPGLGPGNHNSMRMNGYFASRPQFRLFVQRGSGAEFLRDLRHLIANAEVLWTEWNSAQIGSEHAIPLLWVPVWADSPLRLCDVHPLCLEVSRRVRLRARKQGWEVLNASSKTMRVASKETNGLVYDPWTPVMKGGTPRPLTAKADEFSYRRLAPLLFDVAICQLPPMAHPSATELDSGASATLLAQVLVGEQGRTDGVLRREVPMPTFVLRKFATNRGELAARARAFIELAALAQGKVLRAALLQFVDGSDEVNWQNKDFGKAVTPWVHMLERRIDEVFFAELFDTTQEPPLSDADARAAWVAVLRRLVTAVFTDALPALPTRDRSRHLARARAERWLANATRGHLQDMPAPDAPVGASKKTARGRKSAAPDTVPGSPA